MKQTITIMGDSGGYFVRPGDAVAESARTRGDQLLYEAVDAEVLRRQTRPEPALKPDTVRIATPTGTLTIHKADFIRRLPVLEALAKQAGVDADVWQILNFEGIRGAVEPLPSGRFRIMVNATESCPLQRVGVAMHEVEHARRGHCGAAPASVAAYEANEATAMEAGAQAVLALAKDAARRRPAMALRTEECASCYTGDRRACPQGDAILQEVRRTLAPL